MNFIFFVQEQLSTTTHEQMMLSIYIAKIKNAIHKATYHTVVI